MEFTFRRFEPLERVEREIARQRDVVEHRKQFRDESNLHSSCESTIFNCTKTLISRIFERDQPNSQPSSPRLLLPQGIIDSSRIAISFVKVYPAISRNV